MPLIFCFLLIYLSSLFMSIYIKGSDISFIFSTISIIIAVSYTHLDVYKRQAGPERRHAVCAAGGRTHEPGRLRGKDRRHRRRPGRPLLCIFTSGIVLLQGFTYSISSFILPISLYRINKASFCARIGFQLVFI